ncbi:para-aminobenzoate synthase [Hypoxylon rubiginosum]|uniref:Para-aminobenzoate synthase n=1 Tax=Hypoxylon rubiginosum TaxID=110542 RepID=A0ACB9YM25_9PEZI|nr:para-aminobenzoate synthase [Hypoxylon rubiginosum]
MSPPRILFIDAYDSFSNNIVSLLTTTLEAEVDILPIDPPELSPDSPSFAKDLTDLLRHYDAVVCGPGPGSPNLAQDVGLMKYIWELEPAHLVPVLGICLGFQSLVVSCGGIVKKLQTGLHGMIRDIDHDIHRPSLEEGNIFCGVPPFKATLYHSLHADIGQDGIAAGDWEVSKWSRPAHLPDIVPQAWVYENRGDDTERILMGVKHSKKPFWGLQYHPESICTEPTGHQVIQNWFKEAVRWDRVNSRIREPEPSSLRSITRLPKSNAHPIDESMNYSENSLKGYDSWLNGGSELASFGLNRRYRSCSLRLPIHIEVPDIVEILQGGKKDFIILDSASAKASRIGADVRGKYSIIALDVDETMKLEYRAGDRHATARCSSPHEFSQKITEQIPLGPGQTIWQLLAGFWNKRKVPVVDYAPHFLGGFMGFTTYELGLEGIDVNVYQDRPHNRPDLSFAWVTKSIVIDHTQGTVRIQQLLPSGSDGKAWMDSIANKLQMSAVWSDGLRADFTKFAQLNELTPPSTPKSISIRTNILVPDADEYESKVRTCQDYIASGDSYELCLTDQTHITQTRSCSPADSSTSALAPAEPGTAPGTPWQLYRALRSRQPAPFGSFVRLGGATLVSSSPERFLEFDADGLCSMRPMKGTVRKSHGGGGTGAATLADAEAVLHVPKEEAENLMIVDLVRHDLHAACGPGRVRVPKLNAVEEYASVFQMISVVEGRLPSPSPPPPPLDGGNESNNKRTSVATTTGLDVLAASLPPGSMTGAPKKRACEILHAVEGRRERSLYSGVVGYADAAGRGDWSVTIRSLFRWDDEVAAVVPGDGQGQEQGGQLEREVWHIGAGGAVTALSTADGERDEMFVKLKGPLGVFDVDDEV